MTPSISRYFNLVAGNNTTYLVRIGQDDSDTWATVPYFTVL